MQRKGKTAPMHPPRPIIGHVRFSVYGVTDTKLRPDRANAALARLYDETRMARRFFLFERLTLPSLLAQTDQDFRVVIMSSDVMPDRYKDRLLQISEQLPDVAVDISVNRRHRGRVADPDRALDRHRACLCLGCKLHAKPVFHGASPGLARLAGAVRPHLPGLYPDAAFQQ